MSIAIAPALFAQKLAQKEEDFYSIKNVPIPVDVALEVGGLTFLPDDALAVATRHGEVWVISNPYSRDGKAPSYRLYARGMHEPLGLNYINGDLYLTQRSELTRLRDMDGDGRADEYKTVYAWPLAGNYHEYAYGPVLDNDSNMIVTLNLGYTDKAVSLSRWHGWMLKIKADGTMKPFAAGMRSPAAFALNNKGDIFYSENQGEWVGSGSITHVAEGDFMGHPSSLQWAGLPGSPVTVRAADIPDSGLLKFEVAKKVPGLKIPSVWFPQTILGISTSGILSHENKANLGPYEGQLFVGDQGQSKIMRVDLENVKGVYQGVVFPFREGFSSGILRMVWGSDGSMFVGMTSRGWGSTGPALYGLQRLEWNGKLPFEMKTIKAKPDGFDIEFTEPVDPVTARDPSSYRITGFIYKYHSRYGSSTVNQLVCPIKAIEISVDKKKVRLVVDSLREGYIHEIVADGVLSQQRFLLLHSTGYYTLNKIPDGDALPVSAANAVRLAIAHDHTMHKPADVKPLPSKTSAKNSVDNKHITRQPSGWVKGPDKIIQLNPLPGLKFSTSVMSVKTGEKIKLTFKNSDDMLHNIVFTKPESADFVGAEALNMGISGQEKNFIPPLHHVLFYTRLLQPGESETIYFTAPDTPGEYQYLCTYPGHYLLMRGTLRVTKQ